MFTGYNDVSTIPLKRGDKVRIPKGTMVLSRKTGKSAPAGRGYIVVVHSISCGRNEHIYRGEVVPAVNPAVVWPGSGGYWCEADVNDVVKVEA